MFAVKGNRMDKIAETEKESFLKRGFDIILDDGEVIHTPKKTVPYSEVQETAAKVKELEAALEESKKATEAEVAKVKELEAALAKVSKPK